MYVSELCKILNCVFLSDEVVIRLSQNTFSIDAVEEYFDEEEACNITVVFIEKTYKTQSMRVFTLLDILKNCDPEGEIIVQRKEVTPKGREFSVYTIDSAEPVVIMPNNAIALFAGKKYVPQKEQETTEAFVKDVFATSVKESR